MEMLKDKRIFIVEDNTHNRVVFQLALLRDGASLHFERHGWTTVQQLKNVGKVDVIIMDLMLAEGISGFDVIDQIRAIPEYAQVPIVAVSAMDAAIAIPQAQAKGLAGFIAKPIEGQIFGLQIRRILSGEKIWHTHEGRVLP